MNKNKLKKKKTFSNPLYTNPNSTKLLITSPTLNQKDTNVMSSKREKASSKISEKNTSKKKTLAEKTMIKSNK